MFILQNTSVGLRAAEAESSPQAPNHIEKARGDADTGVVPIHREASDPALVVFRDSRPGLDRYRSN